MNTNPESKNTHLSKSNLIQFLKTLSKEEIKEFDKFVRSPFFNNRKEVTRYFLLIKKYHPEFNLTELNKKKIFEKLYPGKSYKDDVMRKLSSNLFGLAEDYFAVSGVDRNKFPFSLNLLDSLSKHGLDDLFMKSFAKIVSEFNKQKINNGTFLLKWIYESEYIDHNLYMSRQSDIVSNAADSGVYNILNFFAHLSINYHDVIANKVKFNYEPKQNLNEKFILNFNFEGFLEGIDNSQNEYLKFLPLYIYHLLLSRFPENEEYYYQYKKEILKHKSSLSNQEIKLSWYDLQNHCLFKYQNGNHKYLNEFYELSCYMMKENIMENYHFIPLMIFNSIVEMNLYAKKTDFVEKFIRKFGSKITPDTKKDTLNLCWTRVYFEKRQFERALEEVNKVKYVHPPIQLWVKFLLSQIYYELDYAELLISHIDAFKHYMVNNRIISEETRSSYGKFLSYLLRLNKLKAEPDSGKLYTLKQSLNDKKNIMNCGHKAWLMEKIEELEKLL